MSVTMYHHPKCSTSRKTLAMLEERGIKPVIELYMDHAPDKKEFKTILGKLGMTARELMRTKDAKAMNLDAGALSEDELIDTMLENPRLIQRPIVLANGKAALGRPPEKVFEIL